MSTIMNKINITPTYDWTKKEVVLQTDRYNPETIITNDNIQQHDEHPFIADRYGNRQVMFYFEDKGEYLGVYLYTFGPLFNRYEVTASDFKNASETNAHIHLVPQSYSGCYYSDGRTDTVSDSDGISWTIVNSETRIYKNRRVANVALCRRKDPETNEVIEQYMINYDTYTIKPLKVVTTNEEIAKSAARVGKKTYKTTLLFTNAGSYNLKDIHNIKAYGGWKIDYVNIAPETQTVIKNFFDCDDSIGDMGALLDVLTKPAPDAKDPVVSKTEKAKALLEFIGTPPYKTYNAENHTLTHYARWGRCGDEIVLCQNTQGCYKANGWDSLDHEIALFAYNVKTKKRFYAERRNDSWSFPIASYNLIQQHFCLYEKAHKSYAGGHYYIERTVVQLEIKDNISIQELFAGSNVGILLEHGDLKTLCCYNASSYTTCVKKISEIITSTHIDNFVFNVIFSTGIPVLEQMLKSGLYNLYLKELESRQTKGVNEASWLESEQNISNKYRYYSNKIQLAYNDKAKNLKQMFGLTMNQLRMLDAYNNLVEWEDTDDNTDQVYYRGYRNGVYLAKADLFYGKPLNNVDDKTFKQILDASKASQRVPSDAPGAKPGTNRTEGLNKGYTALMEQDQSDIELIIQAMGEIPIASKVKVAQTYLSNDTDITIDYLKMREKLKKIQETREDDAVIWNEKKYPTIPTAATKFIPYVEGARDPIINSREARDLVRYSKYGPIKVIYDNGEVIEWSESTVRWYFDWETEQKFREALCGKTGNIVGTLITLSSVKHLTFLHDEIAYWIRFYQDAANDKLFKEAVKRVEPLAWKDEKSGLEIIAPQSIADLNEEGSTLSHCVASYATSIIDGKENIMFLRRSDMINSPYYTVEILNDGEIRQVHCYANGDLTEAGQERAYHSSKQEVYNKTFNIIKFLTDWAKAFPGKINSKSIKASYNALCALR